MPLSTDPIRNAIGVPPSPAQSGVYSFAKIIAENGAGTYNCDFTIPAGAVLFNLGVYAIALWTAATSASLEIGDDDDPDGFCTATDLKATDLTVGQSIEIMSGLASMGGKAGAYSAGTNTHWTNLYKATARTLRFAVVSVGAGTAGRTLAFVTYTFPVNLGLVTQ